MEAVTERCEVDLGSEEAMWVRQRIGEWVQTVPHHGATDLGEAMELERVEAVPYFTARWWTQFDERQVVLRKRPHGGPPRKDGRYDGPGEVPKWEFPGMEREGFTDEEGEWDVPESSWVERCGDCRGRGRIPCSRCRRTGRVTCPSCHGKKSWPCERCGGRKYVHESCGNCSGGTVHGPNGSRSCGRCGGTGREKKPCPQCGGTGEHRCSKCGARGVVDCPVCHGKGHYACESCEETGNLEYRYAVEQTLDFGKWSATHWGGELREQFDRLKLDPDAAGGEVVLDQRAPRLVLEEGLSPDLDQTLSDLGEAGTPESGDDRRIVEQRVEVRRRGALLVAYRYGGERYELLVLDGEDEKRILDGEGPVFQAMWGYYEEAQRLQQAGRSAKSVKLTARAQQMDLWGFFPEIAELHESVEGAVAKTYSYGIVPVILAMGVFIYWLRLVHFPEMRMYFGPLQQWLLGLEGMGAVHPHAFGVVAFLGLLGYVWEKAQRRCEEAFGGTLTGAWARWLAGLVYGLVFSASFVVVLGLLEFSGIFGIVDLIGWGGWQVFQWVAGLFG